MMIYIQKAKVGDVKPLISRAYTGRGGFRGLQVTLLSN